LALGFGGDASFRQPMAVTVIGGLVTSTALNCRARGVHACSAPRAREAPVWP
jgi:hypothetical protein